jgi:hypothetical protein
LFTFSHNSQNRNPLDTHGPEGSESAFVAGAQQNPIVRLKPGDAAVSDG